MEPIHLNEEKCLVWLDGSRIFQIPWSTFCSSCFMPWTDRGHTITLFRLTPLSRQGSLSSVPDDQVLHFFVPSRRHLIRFSMPCLFFTLSFDISRHFQWLGRGSFYMNVIHMFTHRPSIPWVSPLRYKKKDWRRSICVLVDSEGCCIFALEICWLCHISFSAT